MGLFLRCFLRPILLIVAIAATQVGCARRTAPAAPPSFKVAAAADLVFAFGEVGKEHEKTTGQPVTFSFGSTGQLAKQIIEGAPFDLFAAANVSFVDDVVKRGACDPATKSLYARGRVGVWTRTGIQGVQRLVRRRIAGRRGPRSDARQVWSFNRWPSFLT